MPVGRFRPAGIAISPPTDTVIVRAYVSLSSSDNVLSIDISSAGLAIPPANTSSATRAIIPTPGTGGSERVRLSVDPYGAVTANSGITGKFVGTQSDTRRYLYVIGHDGNLHVVWVQAGNEQECETNVDPLKVAGMTLPDGSWPAMLPGGSRHSAPVRLHAGDPALPVERDDAGGSASLDPHRCRGGRRAPRVTGSDAYSSRSRSSGAYAWVLTASGAVYLVNIDPVKRTLTQVTPQRHGYASDPDVSEPKPFPNTLRDRNQISYSASLDPSSGPPRVPIPPAVSFTSPFLEQFWAQGTRNNALAVDATPWRPRSIFRTRPPSPPRPGR